MQNLSEKQQTFLKLRVIEGKSLDTISAETGVEKAELMKWSQQLHEQMEEMKAIEYDKLIEQYGLSNLKRIEYLGELYNRLKDELDKRDFTGLPTDKLYYILSDVRDKISLQSGGQKVEILEEMMGLLKK